jgi:hypothetical protein
MHHCNITLINPKCSSILQTPTIFKVSSFILALFFSDNPSPVHTIDQGRTNYARLGLVVDIFSNILGEIMRSNIAPDALYRLLKNKMTHIEHESVNTLTNRTYDNIDFITLYNFLRLVPLLDNPTQGWGKQPTNANVTISDDVERLRFARNKIGHSIKADIDLNEMNDYFSNIVNITQRIDTYLDKLPNQGFTREVLNFQTLYMDSELTQKYYQKLNDIEDIKGLKLLVFQVYLINLGELSCPCYVGKKKALNLRTDIQ